MIFQSKIGIRKLNANYPHKSRNRSVYAEFAHHMDIFDVDGVRKIVHSACGIGETYHLLIEGCRPVREWRKRVLPEAVADGAHGQ